MDEKIYVFEGMRFIIENVKLHISHTDLDGAGCFVVRRWIRPEEEWIEKEIEVNLVGDTIREFMKDGKLPSTILITDLSFTESTKDQYLARFLNGLYLNGVIDIELIDHHGTALWLNEQTNFSYVRTESGSATKMLYNVYYGKYYMDDKRRDNNCFVFAEAVSRYDTWEWKTEDFYATDEYYNILLHKYGFKNFLDVMSARVADKPCTSVLWDFQEQLIIENHIESRKKSIEEKMKLLKPVKIGEYEVHILIDNVNASSLGEEYLSDATNTDKILGVLYMNNCVLSMRTKRDDIDLGVVAKELAKTPADGGGHQKAAGCTIDKSTLMSIIDQYY